MCLHGFRAWVSRARGVLAVKRCRLASRVLEKVTQIDMARALLVGGPPAVAVVELMWAHTRGQADSASRERLGPDEGAAQGHSQKWSSGLW